MVLPCCGKCPIYKYYNIFLKKRENKMKKIKIFPLFLLMCLMMTAFAPSAWAMEAPQLNGKAAVVIDLDSGKILYGYNENDQRAPASLTKVMTALLALEALDSGRCDLTTMVTAQNDCRDGMSDDSSTSGLVPGMELSMRDLLYCALRQSANEACNIMGITAPPTTSRLFYAQRSNIPFSARTSTARAISRRTAR